MSSFRRHIHGHQWWTAALIVAALFIEMLVPAGYMPGMTGGAFLMQPCAHQGAAPAMPMVAHAPDATPGGAMHGDHKRHPDDKDHGKPEMPCVFSSLAAPALGAVDPILLTIAIAFILAAAFHLEVKAPRARGLHLRPPSQGPPLR